MLILRKNDDRIVILFGGWDLVFTLYDFDLRHRHCRVRDYHLLWPRMTMTVPLSEVEGCRVERHRKTGRFTYVHALLLSRGRRLRASCFGKALAERINRTVWAFLCP